MKKYTVLIIGIVLLIVRIIWMVLSQSSTGLFVGLAAISGWLITEGIFRIKKKKDR